jgi:hypothetical protein
VLPSATQHQEAQSESNLQSAAHTIRSWAKSALQNRPLAWREPIRRAALVLLAGAGATSCRKRRPQIPSLDAVRGWRVPRKGELATLVDRKRRSPKIDTRAFSSTTAAAFWTLSPDTSSPGDAWAVNFHRGKAEPRGSGSRLQVRCVR